MKLIKLNAIDSTNDFLKGLSAAQNLENFTVVTAENQTKGKGQMGSIWNSEKHKNLIMSVFVKDLTITIEEIYCLNIVTTLAIVKVLSKFNIKNLSIKWPNDIMSDNFKLAGILIENSIKNDGSVTTIIGIGLNVNQTNFENLPKATSLAVVSKTFFEKDNLLTLIVNQLQKNLKLLDSDKQFLWNNYLELLFKKDIPMPFVVKDYKPFMGIIRGVTKEGKLILLLENDNLVEFGFKEIQMLY